MPHVDVTVIVDEAARRLAVKAGRSWLDTLESERAYFREAAWIVLATARRHEVLAAGLLPQEKAGL
jgi:hypothetical protein